MHVRSNEVFLSETTGSKIQLSNTTESKMDYYHQFINNIGDKIPMDVSGEMLQDYLKYQGFGDHHVEVYDNWISKLAEGDVCNRVLNFPNGNVITFENFQKYLPRYTRDSKVLDLTPKLAREQGITYGSDWQVDILLRQDGPTGKILARKDNICIGNVPVMLKSQLCYLKGKSPRELALYGEDPKDPGGYLIISGVEKVVLLQEQLALNKIFLMNIDTKGSVVTRMTANTKRGTSLIELGLDKATKSIIELRLPSLHGSDASQQEGHKSINVLSVFRILGVSSLTKIKNMIQRFIKQDPNIIKKSMLKLTSNIVNYELFKDDIGMMADDMDKGSLSDEEKRQAVMTVINDDLFPHLNELPGLYDETLEVRNKRIIKSKLNLLAIMTARFLEYLAGFRPLNNRDSWSNKRVEGAGRVMQSLFRSAIRKTYNIIQGLMKNGSIKDLNGVVEKMRYNIITDTFHDSFITGNWGIKGASMKTNVSQTLYRDSVINTYSHINTVEVPISRTDRQQNIRMVQNTQWGFICPVSSPEGDNCGLIKNLALLAKCSIERDDTKIIRQLVGDELLPMRVTMKKDIREKNGWTDKIIVYGKFIGWCNGKETYNFLLEGRRMQNGFPIDMSVIKEDDWVYVDVGPSRLIRPLLIVNQDQTLAIDSVVLQNGENLRKGSFQDYLSEGGMEYISSWEQEYIKIAVSIEEISKRTELFADAEEALLDAKKKLIDIRNGGNVFNRHGEVLSLEDCESLVRVATENRKKLLDTNKPYTHCEVDPLVILSVAAALIPWPNHNQAPRNTYQVSMGKQALGNYHVNHLNRFDGKTKVLPFSHRPMLETELNSTVGLDLRGPGQNVNVAFMALPYTEEDSFIFKKEFLDRGGFRIYKYITYKTIVKLSGDVVEKLTKPNRRQGEHENRYRFIQDGAQDPSLAGLPQLGAPLRQGDCIIGKIQTVGNDPARNESTFLRVGDEGVVDKILVTTDNKSYVVNVKLRVMRVPEEGDKFAPRNAQKGTIGLVISEVYLPFDEDGICADVFVNTHTLPSRMTLSYPMELLASKHGAYRGVHINGSAFKPFELKTCQATLKKYNKDPMGYESYTSGLNGQPLDTKIYAGPVFFQALKHHVKDKIQARSKGQVKPLSRQPPKGRGNRGGLRFGEMERDAAISHGASSFLRERLMLVSDGYQTVFCKICGTYAVNDPITKGYKKCRLCGNPDQFGKCTIPYAYKLLQHLLGAMGINLHPEFVTSDEYARKIFSQEIKPEKVDLSYIDLQLNEADEGLEEEQEEQEEPTPEIDNEIYDYNE